VLFRFVGGYSAPPISLSRFHWAFPAFTFVGVVFWYGASSHQRLFLKFYPPHRRVPNLPHPLFGSMVVCCLLFFWLTKSYFHLPPPFTVDFHPPPLCSPHSALRFLTSPLRILLLVPPEPCPKIHLLIRRPPFSFLCKYPLRKSGSLNQKSPYK